jgi:RecB family exonuclease
MTMPLFDGRVELRGKMDLRISRKTDDSAQFLDFKTLANYETYEKIAHMAEQLKIYLLLEHANKKKSRVSGAKYRLIKKVKRTEKAKPPFYKDLDIRHNKETLESFWLSLHGVVQNMLDLRQQLDSGTDHRQAAYPTPTNDCTWKCPFFNVCPMFDDGSAAEDYLRDNFEVNDPYARYEEEEE